MPSEPMSADRLAQCYELISHLERSGFVSPQDTRLRELLAERERLAALVENCNHPSSDGIGELELFGQKVFRCGICKTAHITIRMINGFDYTINLSERLIAVLTETDDAG